MRTNILDIYAAGDCVLTHHRLLGESYLPLGTTAHKQGRVAGENAVGGDREFAGNLGTQVVRMFDLVPARTGLRHDEAAGAGFDPATTDTTADDYKVYDPHARPVRVRLTADRRDRRLLGVQLLGVVPTGDSAGQFRQAPDAMKGAGPPLLVTPRRMLGGAHVYDEGGPWWKRTWDSSLWVSICIGAVRWWCGPRRRVRCWRRSASSTMPTG